MSETLSSVFQSVGKGYGYDSVSAEFQSFREFKLKWRRSCGWIEFEASDYLKDDPSGSIGGVCQKTADGRVGGAHKEASVHR